MEFNATFLVSAISFVVFTLIMNKILYKPVSDIISKRQAYLDENFAETKKNLDEAKSIQSDREQQLVSAKSDSKQMILEEVEHSKIEKNKKEVQKRQELASLLDEQKTSISVEKNKVSDELKSKVDDVSNAIITKLIGGGN